MFHCVFIPHNVQRIKNPLLQNIPFLWNFIVVDQTDFKKTCLICIEQVLLNTKKDALLCISTKKPLNLCFSEPQHLPPKLFPISKRE